MGQGDLTYEHTTHYSYDIHGHVKHLVQSLPRLSGDIRQLGQDGGSGGNPNCVDHPAPADLP